MKSILFILTIFTLIPNSYSQIQFPAFTFTDLSGKVFQHTDLDPNKSTMIMLFDPYCHHCEQQADWIHEAEENFKDVQFVFVTIEPEKEPIIAFKEKHFENTQLEHLYFLQDLDFRFEDFFGYTDDAVNIYLYHPNKKQAKYFGSEQKTEILLKFL